MQESASQPASGTVALRIQGLSKTFVGQQALSDVDLDLRSGEIHALVGQNGSGKSTLIKVLSGFHEPDPGARAWMGDREISLGHPSAEDKAFMHFIHQDRALVETLTVRENLGLEELGGGLLSPIRRRRERDRTRELLSTFELDIDPDATVSKLTPFEKSAVAIARAIGALGANGRVLVLDEPTAALGALDAERLFGTLRLIREHGVAVLYVSHYLGEVIALADRITVLRDGRRVAVRDAKHVSEDELVELIVGEKVIHPTPPTGHAGDPSAPLQLRGVSAQSIDGITLSAYAGEVLGLTGLVGSGYEAIAACLGGLIPLSAGEIVIEGIAFTSLPPHRAIEHGIVMMPADRLGSGLIGSFTVKENLTLPRVGDSWRRGLIWRKDEDADVRRWLNLTGVVPADPYIKVQQLSGGNQQKVMLAKALRLAPKILVLIEPTQAVDVGASAAIRHLIVEASRDHGRIVIVASSDAKELEQICHRVVVTRGGVIAAELVGGDITEDRLVHETQALKEAA